MIVGIASGAAGDDRFQAAHGALVRDARAAFADAASHGSKEALAPASARRQLAAGTRELPDVVALRRERGSSGTAAPRGSSAKDSCAMASASAIRPSANALAYL